MPQVASEAQTFALSRPLPSFRPASAPDQAPATPFASLLDDSTQGAVDRTPPPPPDDSASRADRQDQAQQTAQDADSQAAKSNDDAKPADANATDAKTNANVDSKTGSKPGSKSEIKSAHAGKGVKSGKADKTAKPATDSKMTSDGTPVLEAIPAVAGDAKPTVAGDAKPAIDGKPTDAKTPADLAAAAAAAAPAGPVPAATPAEAIAALLAPAPVAIAQISSAADSTAIAATAKAKPDTLAALRVDADKSTGDAKPTAKTAPNASVDAKPQTTDADKDTIAQARGELAAKDNHAAAAQAPGTAATDVASPKGGADIAQSAALTAPPQNTAPAASTLAAAPQLAPQALAVPLTSVAIEIANKALAGTNHFEIRLDPPELGHIEVRLDVDRDGNVTSRMIADRADTLDLLRSDASGLERALQDAGLKTADNGLQFSLRDQSGNQQQDTSGSTTTRLVVNDEMLPVTDATQRIYSRLAGQGSGIDIHV